MNHAICISVLTLSARFPRSLYSVVQEHLQATFVSMLGKQETMAQTGRLTFILEILFAILFVHAKNPIRQSYIRISLSE
jgi:hypothetical protein